MHPFDRMARRILPIGATALLATLLLVGWVAEPGRYEQGYTPDQPIPFSHKLHAGDNKIPCQYCHTGAAISRHAGVPPTQTCMNCHSVTRTDRPSIQKLAAAHETGEAIPWVRIHSLPDHVYFDHRPHVNAGVACQTCHGEVQKMTRVTRVMDMRMGACLACHRDPGAALSAASSVTRGPENCYACHR